MFVSIYGAEAGNLALKIMATGGIYLGGATLPKCCPSFPGRYSCRPFTSKGRMQALLESMPVRVITNDRIALLGAARCALVESAAMPEIQHADAT